MVRAGRRSIDHAEAVKARPGPRFDGYTERTHQPFGMLSLPVPAPAARGPSSASLVVDVVTGFLAALVLWDRLFPDRPGTP